MDRLATGDSSVMTEGINASCPDPGFLRLKCPQEAFVRLRDAVIAEGSLSNAVTVPLETITAILITEHLDWQPSRRSPRTIRDRALLVGCAVIVLLLAVPYVVGVMALVGVWQ